MTTLLRYIGRFALVVLIAFLIGAIAMEVSGEIFLREYIATTGTDPRLERDLGYGLVGLGNAIFTFVVAFGVSAPTAWFLLWRFWWRKKNSTDIQAEIPKPRERTS